MRATETNGDAIPLALTALGWTVGDSIRAQRLLDMTGLGVDDLRARAGDPAVLAAVLGFLEAYEPDLIACAEAIGVKPAELVAARATLESL
ncbi:MAG: DUF3572 domain-containing protein [Alphaproteobacteria bacterium HGW-Alphaproteobacteria-16]|nr:MAG: DUF3572 domain-containing protein [Alphaproteobacteria bacterium HGW-Alphaproteobacteria-16]